MWFNTRGTRGRARRLRKAFLVAAALVVVMFCWAPAASAAQKRTIILVVDISDSMNSDGRLIQAQAALRSTIGALDKNDVVGLHTFSGNCGDGGDLIVPPGTGNRDELRREVDNLTAFGGTPTPDAIRAAVSEFPDDSSEKVLMLVSDGESSCEDPCEVVTQVQQDTGVEFVAHTVGFQTDDEADQELNEQLNCIAEVTGGKFFAAEDEKAIADSLEEALATPVGDDVSTVLHSLPSPSDVPLDAKSVGISAALGAAFVLAIGFPAELFNRTFEANQARIARSWRRRGGPGTGPAGSGGSGPGGGGGGGGGPYPPDGSGGGSGTGPGGAPGGAGDGAAYGQRASDAGAYGQHAGGLPTGSTGMEGAAGGGGTGAGDAGSAMHGDISGAEGGVSGGFASGGPVPGATGGAAVPGAAGGVLPGATGGASLPGAAGGVVPIGAGGAAVPGAGGGVAAGAAGGVAAGAGGGVVPLGGAGGTAPGIGAIGAARSLWASPWILPIFVLVSAIASTFVDPESGFNTKSGILLLGFVVAVPLVIFSYAWPNEQVARRASHVPAALRTVPAALGLAIFCTVLSRVSEFVPGYVFGLVLGYVTLRERRLTRAQEGKGVLLGALTALVVSVGAWVGLEFVHDKAIEPGANVGLVIADTVLATTFILGVETVIFGLVPLRVLDGNKLRKWNTWFWAGTYALAILLFVHVLLLNSDAAGSDNDASVTGAVVLFAVFALVSLGFWAWFKYIPDPALLPRPAFAGGPHGPVPPPMPAPMAPPMPTPTPTPMTPPMAPPAPMAGPQATPLPPQPVRTPSPATPPPMAPPPMAPPTSPPTAPPMPPPPPVQQPYVPPPARPPVPPAPAAPPPPATPPRPAGLPNPSADAGTSSESSDENA